MFFKYSFESFRSFLLSQNDLILESFIFAFFIDISILIRIRRIDSIEVTFCVIDVLLFVTDAFSKLVSISSTSDSFDVFTINEKNDSISLVSIFLFIVFFDSKDKDDSTDFVSILLFSLEFFSSKMNCDVIDVFLCEKDDFNDFITFEFLDSS